MSMPATLPTFFLCFSVITLLLATLCPSPVCSQACHRACGNLPINYPFGTGSGCGDPRFGQYVTCHGDDQILTLKTHTGSYPVTDIDYANQVMYIADPTMSTCFCSRHSQGFGLDWDAPFSFNDDTLFTLLNCDVDSSPVFKTPGNGTSRVPLCDKQSGAPVCSYLYSNCRAISSLNPPIGSCCVYTPVDLGPAFEMNLEKLKCSGYSGFYSFRGKDTQPENWKYGISLKYKFNVYDAYPGACEGCERSNGACGFNNDGGYYKSFVCSCPGGLNSSSDCFFINPYNAVSKLPYHRAGSWLASSFTAWILNRVLL